MRFVSFFYDRISTSKGALRPHRKGKVSMKRTKLLALLTSISCILLTIVLVGSYFTAAYAMMINKELGIVTTSVVTDDPSKNATYYASSFLKEDGTRDDDALTAWQKALCEQIQGEGSVLLTNNGALPMEKGLGVTVFGRGAVDTIYGGTGSGQVDTSKAATMTSALTAAGLNVNTAMMDWYSAQIAQMKEDKTNRSTPGMFTEYAAVPAATRIAEVSADAVASSGVNLDGYKDAAIVVIGRSGGEGADLYTGEFTDGTSYFELQDSERELLKYVASQGFSKTIVLINSSNAMAMDWVNNPEYGVDACLWIGGPGQYGLNAVSQILVGDVNPSGRLVDTYSVSSLSSAAIQNFGSYVYTNADEETGTVGGVTIDGVPGDKTKVRYAIHYLVESEGIYVGYKYYETRYFDAVMGQGNANSAAGATQGSAWNYGDEMLYTFGHGLSYLDYTQTIKSVTVDRSVNGNITAVVEVKNNSNQDGKFLTQLYVQQPYTDYDRTNLVEKSAVMFLNSAKVDVAAGKSKEVTITIPTKYLASYDANNAKTYILDAGDYYFTAAAGAHEAVNNILAAQGKTVADGMDAAGSKAVVSWKLDQLDNTTFAIANNTTVTNVADDADLNYWLPGTVTYLTRQDWNTFPINYNKLNLKIADSPKKDQWIAEMRGETYTISDTGAAAEAVPGPKFTASEIGAEQLNNINDPYWDKLVHAITIDEAVGAVIHGGSRSDTLTNIDNPVVIQNEGPTGISAGYTDEATGKTYKFNVNSQTLLGCSFNPELAYQWGLVEGNSCLWVERYDLWGSGLTLNRTPYNGRNYEYISEDPMLTNVIGREVIQGCSDKGIINGPKHMGFNDQEHNRAGISAYMTEQKFRETDLRGFEGALSDAFGMGVMIAFNRIGATNASHHVGMIQKIVRGEWGFKGLISTDMMNNYLYFNAESMVMAGITQVADFAADNSHINLGEGGVDAVWPHISLETVSKDSNLVEQARENLKYQLYIFANSAILNISTQRVNTWWDTALTVTTYASSILAVLFFLAWVVLTLLPEKKPVVVRVENKR